MGAVKVAKIVAGALLGAGAAYLICVWMTGYFYSPLLHGAHLGPQDAQATRYAMLNGFLFGGAGAGLFSK